ncbi:uncharacterized protein [Ptychodera flava]|uniref:uncharacterized protein isoform X2 n=1 Tax=Ptychodera flava TaxID=63121 RepID=UPI00396A69FD
MKTLQNASYYLSFFKTFGRSCSRWSTAGAQQSPGIRVLALLPTWKDKLNLQLEKLSVPDEVKLIEANSPTGEQGTMGNRGFCFTAFMKHCEDMIEKHSIDFILSGRDDTSVVKAALRDKFPHIPGPTLESTLLCYDKYLTRKYTDTDPSPVKYTHLDPENFTSENLKEALEYVGCPAIIKPCVGTASFGVAKVTCLQGMVKQMNIYKKFPASGLGEFLRGRISHDKYSEAFKNGIILEEHVDASATVAIDGFIANNQIIQWPAHDLLYWKSKPSCNKAFLLPSNLDKDVLENVQRRYRDIATRMMGYGYNNDFLSIEFLIQKNGDCKLMEVNPRMFSPLINLYNKCYTNGNPVQALLDFAQNKPIRRPIQVQYGLNSLIVSFNKKPTRLSDLLELNDPSTKDLFTPFFSPDEEVPLPYGDSGSPLAVADFAAPRREDLLPAYHTLCKKVLKKPEWSPED